MAIGRVGRWCSAAVASAAVVGSMLAAPAIANAEGDFYAPPSPLPSGNPGDVLRSEPSDLAIRVPTSTGIFPAQGTRLLYRSNDANGAPNAVSGTYLEPSVPWSGSGERPLVVFAPGTIGQGDQCAPSKALNYLLTYEPPLGLFTEYELLSIDALLVQGIAVVITDYDGIGTPGVHTYVNRLAGGQAVLDAARAAQRLPGTSVPDDGPVGFFGYSQGGGASASAVELAPSYAPDLDVRGAVAGAPPADLAATLAQIDGTSLAGVIGYAINGLQDAYPQVKDEIDGEINDAGRAMLAEVANECVPETILRHGFQRTSNYTKSGEPISAILERLPEAKSVVEEQRIGRLKPEAPVLIQHAVVDDSVPFGQGRQLALDWCAQGATVQFSPNTTPPIFPGLGANHMIPMFTGLPESVPYLVDRFNGLPAPSNCGQF
ncbi:MAG: lipase family protein [Rhodococcus sp. (in: high G+C Gram-positive bacteria)]|uniref:lipase family protein n=1 Tax=Rhodococcus sp. TaxID=1831 RepID=UPI003BB50005